MNRRRFLGWVLVGISATVSSYAGKLYSDSQTEFDRYGKSIEWPTLRNYDTAIVLGGGGFEEESLSRVAAGVHLYREGYCKRIVFSSVSFSRLARDYALTVGIPDRDIILEDRSRSTVGNAYFAKTKVILPNEWTKCLIVSSDFHIPRTRFIFRKIFGNDIITDFIGVATSPSAFTGYEGREKWLLFLNKLVFAGIIDGDHDGVRRIYQILGQQL